MSDIISQAMGILGGGKGRKEAPKSLQEQTPRAPVPVRPPAAAPKPKFKIGDSVNIMDNGRVLDSGVVSFVGQYDDFLGDYRYKVQTATGRKHWNGSDLKPAPAPVRTGDIRERMNKVERKVVSELARYAALHAAVIDLRQEMERGQNPTVLEGKLEQVLGTAKVVIK